MSVFVLSNKINFTEIVEHANTKAESVCHQSVIERGLVGHYMQSVSHNAAINCDKLVKITHQ